MLLRRGIKHVREQNWTAVTIDQRLADMGHSIEYGEAALRWAEDGTLAQGSAGQLGLVRGQTPHRAGRRRNTLKAPSTACRVPPVKLPGKTESEGAEQARQQLPSGVLLLLDSAPVAEVLTGLAEAGEEALALAISTDALVTHHRHCASVRGLPALQ